MFHVDVGFLPTTVVSRESEHAQRLLWFNIWQLSPRIRHFCETLIIFLQSIRSSGSREITGL